MGKEVSKCLETKAKRTKTVRGQTRRRRQAQHLQHLQQSDRGARSQRRSFQGPQVKTPDRGSHH